MEFGMVIMLIQLFFGVVIGLYFWNLLRGQKTNRSAVERESRKELEKLRKLRSISLTKPLSEKTRPATINDIVGQKMGCVPLKLHYAVRIRNMLSFMALPESGRQLPQGLCWKRPRRIHLLLSSQMRNSRSWMQQQPVLMNVV